MQEITTDKLQIAYVGPALKEGRMPMASLAVGLRGQALLIHRVNELLYGEASSIRVEVGAEFEAGSLIVPVHILSDALKGAEHLLAGQAATALANLMQFVGFIGGSGVTIYHLFKRLRGRRIEKPEDLPKDLNINVSIELLIRVYNDPEVQAQLRKTIDPLHQDGIEEFQTRRQGTVIQTVRKADLQAADEAEIQDITRDEEVELDIEKTAWRRDLAWHFSNDGVRFDAKIKDDLFWKNIEQGEAFAVGDRLRVHLQTTVRRTANGVLKVQRVIPQVLGVDHVRRKQPNLFDRTDSVTP
jgi:hypothetical protein